MSEFLFRSGKGPLSFVKGTPDVNEERGGLNGLHLLFPQEGGTVDFLVWQAVNGKPVYDNARAETAWVTIEVGEDGVTVRLWPDGEPAQTRAASISWSEMAVA